MMQPRLIVALDYDNSHTALAFVDQVDPAKCALKVGSELFTCLGTSFVSQLIQRNFKVFLDLKFHDIPNTVARACKVAADLGVWMLNVHASGGMEMLMAARRSLETFQQMERPLLIAVTVLTSMDDLQLSTLGITRPLNEQVLHLAKMAIDAELDGVVCSALEVPDIKSHCGQRCITVTPGIRLSDNNTKDDQSRVTTPEQAIALGSDFLVVGRPITRAANPSEAIAKILAAMSCE